MFRSHVVTFRPIESWPGPVTKNRLRSTFRASYDNTCRLLDRELTHLGARNVVIQLDCDASQIRRDGMPRADARLNSPKVILSFDTKHGPLSYPCDRYQHWDCNIRAIALSLEALRAVDRYGVTRNAEQYRGWQKLGHDPAVAGGQVAQARFADAEEAADWAIKTLARPAGHAELILKHREFWTGLRKEIIRAVHPDRHGGDASRWREWQEAERVLNRHHGIT